MYALRVCYVGCRYEVEEMTDEETFTYSRTVPVAAARVIFNALRANSIPSRGKWSPDHKMVTIYVKPERQRRLDKFVDRFDNAF